MLRDKRKGKERKAKISKVLEGKTENIPQSIVVLALSKIGDGVGRTEGPEGARRRRIRKAAA